MVSIPQYFNGKQVGIYDTDTKTYYRVINKNQQFLHPKYSGMLGISQTILKELVKLGCEKFQWTLTEWEDEPFYVIITIREFLDKREELYFSGKTNSDKQYGVRLHHWTRIYMGQKRLEY